MVEVAAHLGMVFVNETAALFRFFSPIISDNDFPAVWDAELLFVMWVNKTYALFCSGNMLIKPFFHIAVTVKIIITFGRITTEQESVFLRIHTEAILCTIVTLKL